jgi:hypothetical protein
MVGGARIDGQRASLETERERRVLTPSVGVLDNANHAQTDETKTLTHEDKGEQTDTAGKMGALEAEDVPLQGETETDNDFNGGDDKPDGIQGPVAAIEHKANTEIDHASHEVEGNHAGQGHLGATVASAIPQDCGVLNSHRQAGRHENDRHGLEGG